VIKQLQAARRSPFGPLTVTLAATILWILSVQRVRLEAMTDSGLISVLPSLAFIALGLMIVSFWMALQNTEIKNWVLLIQVAALVFALFGTTSLIEDVPRFHVTWRHAGVVDYIMRTGDIDPGIDAYFNWPGFFILGALFTKLTGFDNALVFAGWAPMFFNLLYLGPLLMIMRSATKNRKIVWLAILLFYISNWIAQDYFAPQAFTYFLYFSVLAILLTWFQRADGLRPLWRAPASSSAPPHPPVSTEPQAAHRKIVLIGVVTGIALLIVSSHPLTPFFLLVAVTALVVFNRSTLRGLPVIVAVLTATWISFMTLAYMKGHFGILMQNIGEIEAIFSQNVSERLQGSPGHLLVVRIRFLVTGFLWLLALAGVVQRKRSGRLDASYALLALAPAGVLALQPYGGELLLRVHFFALPFLAFFASSFLLEGSARPAISWRRLSVAVATCFLFIGGFFVARYGNERGEYFTSSEAVAVDHVYDVAPRGSLILAVTDSLPWASRGYEAYEVDTLLTGKSVSDDGLPSPTEVADSAIERMATYDGDAYLVITRSQEAFAELLGLSEAGGVSRIEAALERSGAFDLVYSNNDATVFTLDPRFKGVETS
jgi:hypothetical protein